MSQGMIVRVPEGEDEVSAILDAAAGPILSNEGAMAAAAAPPAARARNTLRDNDCENVGSWLLGLIRVPFSI